MRSYLDFEKPVAELDSKIDELHALAASGSNIGEEIAKWSRVVKAGNIKVD